MTINMKKLFKILFLAIALINCAEVFAQETSEEYERLLDEVVRENVEHTDMVKTLKGAFQMYVDNGLMKESSLEPMCKEMADLAKPKTIAIVKQIWGGEFTLEELREIKTWFDSPTGKKMIGMTSKSADISVTLLKDPEYLDSLQKIISKYMK